MRQGSLPYHDFFARSRYLWLIQRTWLPSRYLVHISVCLASHSLTMSTLQNPTLPSCLIKAQCWPSWAAARGRNSSRLLHPTGKPRSLGRHCPAIERHRRCSRTGFWMPIGWIRYARFVVTPLSCRPGLTRFALPLPISMSRSGQVHE